jgi:hypothetical protein
MTVRVLLVPGFDILCLQEVILSDDPKMIIEQLTIEAFPPAGFHDGNAQNNTCGDAVNGRKGIGDRTVFFNVFLLRDRELAKEHKETYQKYAKYAGDHRQ